MRFELRHITQYHYEEPVHESLMEVWMQPQQSAHQRLLSFDLEVDPHTLVFSYADNYGNTVHHFDLPQPHQALRIEARAAVETVSLPQIPEALPLATWAALDHEATRGECWDFLRLQGYCAASPALSRFADVRGLASPRNTDPLTAAKRLMTTLYEAFGYEQGITGADSPIDHALAEGKGVCQDFAHIMIAICRGWGLPARYVSGYLFTNQDVGDRSDPDATHAWVEVYLASLGWVGFDPTNNVLAGVRHITTAIGRDYADVPPSRGVFKGDSQSQLSVGVSVRETGTGPAQPEFMRLGAPAIAAARKRATSAALMDQRHQQQ